MRSLNEKTGRHSNDLITVIKGDKQKISAFFCTKFKDQGKYFDEKYLGFDGFSKEEKRF